MAVLGIDIGGTKTMVAVADDCGEIVSQARIHTPREQGPDAVLSEIEFAGKLLLQEAELGREEVKAIGIGCGGPLDRRRGIILTAPNLPGWDDLPLAEYFEKSFGAPAYLDNDVNLAALGEARRGAGKGVDDLAYFNIGTGIGGGIIIGGKLYRGCGNAGEFGHQIIEPKGPTCLCGKRGCLESLASGTSIARRAKEYLAVHWDSLIVRMAGTVDKVTAESVAQAAREGDELAQRIWRETGEYLGLGVANVVNILNPRRVVLGGGVIEAGDLILDPVRQTVRERAMTQLAEDVQIVPGALSDQAGIIGAICLAIERG